MTVINLVFPSSMMESHAFSRAARARGEKVVGASSVRADETAKHYDNWVYLPTMYEPGFGQALAELIESEGITYVFTPHMVIYLAIKALIDEQVIRVNLCKSPIETLEYSYRDVFSRAGEAQSFIAAINGQVPSLHLTASLFHYGEQIYGQTSETKIAVMAAVCANAPKGDIIEIGSAWGRSAFVLAMLATYFDLGNLLCIDPWDYEADHYKTDPRFVNETNDSMDWDLTFKIFCTHLAQIGRAHV